MAVPNGTYTQTINIASSPLALPVPSLDPDQKLKIISVTIASLSSNYRTYRLFNTISGSDLVHINTVYPYATDVFIDETRGKYYDVNYLSIETSSTNFTKANLTVVYKISNI